MIQNVHVEPTFKETRLSKTSSSGFSTALDCLYRSKFCFVSCSGSRFSGALSATWKCSFSKSVDRTLQTRAWYKNLVRTSLSKNTDFARVLAAAMQSTPPFFKACIRSLVKMPDVVLTLSSALFRRCGVAPMSREGLNLDLLVFCSNLLPQSGILLLNFILIVRSLRFIATASTSQVLTVPGALRAVGLAQ